jgi:hypothetical protein
LSNVEGNSGLDPCVQCEHGAGQHAVDEASKCLAEGCQCENYIREMKAGHVFGKDPFMERDEGPSAVDILRRIQDQIDAILVRIDALESK